METIFREKNILADFKSNCIGVKICQTLSSQGKKRKANKRATGYTGKFKCRDYWVKKEQNKIAEIKQKPEYRVEEDEEIGILKCYGRIQGYNPTYLQMGLFAEKLVSHTHQGILHFGIADTMAAFREN